MPVTSVEINYTPRGGVPGSSVTVSGSGFQVVAGEIIFDPLGQAVAANITSWDPLEIVFEVPTLPAPLTNQFILVQLKTVANDGGAFWFWSPATGYGATPTAHPGIDYQLPLFDAGADQDVDDPHLMQAADFNRLLEMAALALADGTPTGPAGGDLAGTYPNPTVGQVGGQTAGAVAGAVTGFVAHLIDPAAHGSTATPAPNAIPRADGAGSLDAWVGHYTDEQAAIAAQVFS